MLNLFFSVLASGILVSNSASAQISQNTLLSMETYSLADRYIVPSVNQVFDDNILLTLAYMDGEVKKGDTIDWNKIREDGEYTFTLKPGEIFAFHDSVLPEYVGKITLTTNAHFTYDEGFESDGWLTGDGVCHLASFMNVAAKAAGLTVVAPTRHNFAAIPEVSEPDGVAIYDSPDDPAESSMQNLYITNNKDYPITFTFTHKKDILTIDVTEKN